MARSWSARARRDFREREDYRKRNDEKDRYEKRDDRDDRRDDRREDRRDDRRTDREISEDAREDRREERGYWDSYDDFESTLMNIRDADPNTDVNDKLDRIRRSYDFYEAELDKYDADYDELMKRYRRVVDDNKRYMMRDSGDAREDGRVVDEMQDKDIKQDGEEMTYRDLWKTRED